MLSPMQGASNYRRFRVVLITIESSGLIRAKLNLLQYYHIKLFNCHSAHKLEITN
jgi:hypothetical protein